MKDLKNNITHEAIAKRAYELYLARGSKSGSATEDWLRAEADLKAKAQKTAAPVTVSAPKSIRPLPTPKSMPTKTAYKGSSTSLR